MAVGGGREEGGVRGVYGDGGCRGNAKARVHAFDPFSRVSLAAVAGTSAASVFFTRPSSYFYTTLPTTPQHAQSARIRPGLLRPRQHPDVHCGPVGAC